MTEQKNTKQTNYYTDAMRIIESNEYTRHQYMQLSDNESWKSRFCDYLRGTKTLPLLYDPFFKAIFNPDINKDRLAKLISAILGQEVTVVEILPNEDSSMMGTLIIMDILVRMSDGSLANIEVQKAPYLFPAERISCYSSDLMMRQYNRIKNMSQNGKKFSYKDLHRVHTIIFYENSSECLKSSRDERLYFHVGKTKFNTGIDIELLQDFHLISLDTFKEYRYPNIIQGDTTVTGYDCDESVYKHKISEEMKRNRLIFLSLFVTDTTDDMSRLLSIYPELEDIVRDMGQYLSRPEEVLNMFSESLRILDKNSMDLLIDEAMERAEKAEAKAKLAEDKAKQSENKAQLAEARADKIAADSRQEIERLKLAESRADKIAADARQEIERLKKEIEELKHQ